VCCFCLLPTALIFCECLFSTVPKEPFVILSTNHSMSNKFYASYNTIYRESNISFRCCNTIHIYHSNSGTFRVMCALESHTSILLGIKFWYLTSITTQFFSARGTTRRSSGGSSESEKFHQFLLTHQNVRNCKNAVLGKREALF
jgi:hypothetical protein